MAHNMTGLNMVRTFVYKRNVRGGFQFEQVRDFVATAVTRKVTLMQAEQYSKCLCFGNTGSAHTPS
jgi:hypothetical protein